MKMKLSKAVDLKGLKELNFFSLSRLHYVSNLLCQINLMVMWSLFQPGGPGFEKLPYTIILVGPVLAS